MKKRKNLNVWPAMSMFLLLIVSTATGGTIYVDADASGANNGSSWTDAYNYLQDALAGANSGDEVWVAQGIYKPDQGGGQTAGDRYATFQLINGITIKGGYAGFGEPDPNTRDIGMYETTLSGDLNGDDGPDFTNNGENSYHVVTGSGTDETTVLDGFTITAGNASHYSYKDSCGGGMYNWPSSLTVINCTFTGNYAGNDDGGGAGAGMYNVSGNPTVTNCKFIGNSAIALDGGEGYGGGMYNGQSNPTLTNCTFMENTAGHDGGGMYNYESSPTLANCAFSGNLAREGGTGSYGGGMYNDYFANPTLTNCTFSGNTARADYAEGGGGIYNGTHTRVTLINCIFWANSSSQGSQVFLYRSDKTSIRYCDIQDGAGGVYVFNSFLEWLDGNIDVDPCFVKPGYWDANELWVEGDYHLLRSSPCINAGDPNYIAEPNEMDLDGNPRVIAGRIDMGAYEFLRASKIIYVDVDATGNNDGSSWADAFNFLQDALTAAWSGDEIRVAEGTYKPDQGAGITLGDREATFQLVNGVILKGGYAGEGTPDPNARDIELYETILSGDLNGNDVDVNEPLDLFDEPSRAENSYHIVTGSGVDLTTLLDGFTITAGNADGPHQENKHVGAGMYNDKSSLKLVSCTFSENSAKGGGGMRNEGNSDVVLINCKFYENLANFGGGMYNKDSNPTLTNCTFNGNSVSQNGGGIYNQDGNLILTNCTFSYNEGNYGGGIDNHSGHAILADCLFSMNYAWGGAGIGNSGNMMLTNCSFTRNSGWGSGIAYYGNMTLTNCIFSGNSGSGMGGFGKILLTNCTFTGNGCGIQSLEEDEYGGPTLTNCILWGNGSEINWDIEPPIVNYCCIQGLRGNLGGIGNIDADPLFTDPNSNDYHLLKDSPCIDVGDPNYIAEPNETDLDGRPRIIGGRIDMGAYEYSPPILADVRIVPRTINLRSMGKWITCYISLPEDYNVADIDPNRVFLEHEFKAESLKVDEEQQVAIAKFSRSGVQGVLEPGDVELTVSGELSDGTRFEGTDTIRVIDKGRKK